MVSKEELEKISMEIILLAGDARQCVHDATRSAMEYDFMNVADLFSKADKSIEMAHIAQTDMIQKSLEDENFEIVNFLFIHAQDTLMTIKSEVNLSKMFIEMYKSLIKSK